MRNQADSKQEIAAFTWDQISDMLKNVSGIQVDYETFKVQYDNLPQLSKIVDKFDDQGITLKTKNQPTDTSGADNKNALMTSAKRAANNTLQQPG